MDTQLIIFICIQVHVFLFWLSVVIYREIKREDVMVLRKKTFFGRNGWGLAHFIHYFVLGYHCPDYWKLALVIGILFEAIEYPLSKISKYIDSNPIQDMITNSAGLAAGVAFHYYTTFCVEIVRHIL
tara:strand:+ start:408 stop:788 length:381 start_codon:yes stop_codon:yes gene_type:complete